jgi:hypothetical protein
MDRECDLFDVFPDCPALWRITISGHEEATEREYAAPTANEVRLMHLPSNTLIAAMNTRAIGKPTDSTAG